MRNTLLSPPSDAQIERLVRMALEEDAPWGDLTSQALVPVETRFTASLVAREAGILCGAALFAAAMRLTDAAVSVDFKCNDAMRFAAGDILAVAEGPARAILQAERVALNLVQRLSGIATMTAKFVGEVAGTSARIVDTRKTTPGLRLFERYAVRCGGGHNHRFSLSDAVMAKDNHLAALGAATPEVLSSALRAARERLPHTTHIEVEVDRTDQIEAVLAAGVDTIMLDNFPPEQRRSAVQSIRARDQRIVIEASGNVRLDTVRAIAETGVDVISVGALTHSVRSLDLGLDILAETASVTASQ